MAALAVWRQRDGTEIAVRDMSDDHLRNVARMLLRKAERLHLSEALAMARAAEFCNGEMALEAIESEIAEFQEMCPEHFVEERWAPIFNACRRRRIKLGET